MSTKDNCRLCTSENTNKVFLTLSTHGRHILNIDDKFILKKCLDCQCLFISEIEANADYYKKYYEPDVYSGNIQPSLVSKTWSFIYATLFGRKEKYILKYFKNKKEKITILDVGCGNGNFLAGLDPNKFSKYGIEISPREIDLCKEKNISVYEKNIEQIDFSGKKFDVITLWHVFEHLEKPANIFEIAKEILNDNGVLILQVPNSKSWGFRIGRELWFHLDSPRHLIIPNKEAIKKIGEKTGFKIVAIKNEFYDYPLDLFWSVRKSALRFLIYPFYPLFKIMSKEHLTYICKKKND